MPFFDRAAFWLLAALIVWAPIPLGSNRPWAWSILEIGIFTAGLLWLAGFLRREQPIPSAARAAWPALALLAAWLAFLLAQCVPLPAGLVQLLSPRAAELHAAAGYLAPDHYVTLSIDPHASFVFWLKSCAYGVAFALVLCVALARERAGAPSAIGRYFAGLGVCSYSLYLLHRPIQLTFEPLARHVAAWPFVVGHGIPSSLLIMAATTPIVLGLTRLFYRYCEAPWVRRSHA